VHPPVPNSNIKKTGKRSALKLMMGVLQARCHLVAGTALAIRTSSPGAAPRRCRTAGQEALMTLRLAIGLAAALALAAPAAAKDKQKEKEKDKAKQAQRSDSRDDRHGDDDDGDRSDGRDRITVCHGPNGRAGHTITVSESAWSAHRAHGDYRGSCDGRRIVVDDRDGRRRLGTFDELDRNDDGAVSRREWTGSAATFERLDNDHDGFLTRFEFSRG
jgi:hypothetical protein